MNGFQEYPVEQVKRAADELSIHPFDLVMRLTSRRRDTEAHEAINRAALGEDGAR